MMSALAKKRFILTVVTVHSLGVVLAFLDAAASAPWMRFTGDSGILLAVFYLIDFPSSLIGIALETLAERNGLASHTAGVAIQCSCFLVFGGLQWYVFARAVESRKPEPDYPVCKRCGYDLRASVAFGRCPECGTTIVRSYTQGDFKNSD